MSKISAFTIGQVVNRKLLPMSRYIIRNMIKKGDIKAMKINSRRTLIATPDIEKWWSNQGYNVKVGNYGIMFTNSK